MAPTFILERRELFNIVKGEEQVFVSVHLHQSCFRSFFEVESFS